MAVPSISPLRVQKTSNNSSPTKMAFAQSRPLSEISPMALRRNSPSFPRGNTTKRESSPAGSSPFNGTNPSATRSFWQGRDPASPASENRNPYELPTPSKRSSIENLKKASRVKNSSMFAREQKNYYDPSKPNILDGKPLTSSVQGNANQGRGLDDTQEYLDSDFTEMEHDADIDRFTQTQSSGVAPLSPSKNTASPTKSSLSRKTGANMRRSNFDPDTSIWEDEDSEEKKLPEGRTLHRHAKSVTFDKAPPQINEYEMTTPDPSSVASGSREGSYDSFDEDEDDDEYNYEREVSVGHDDSFDASLEDTDKTPVVLPEEWRFMSPGKANTDLARHEEDVFDNDVGSPEPTARPNGLSPRPHQTSVNSVDSNGQSRPLPPLPPPMTSGTNSSITKDSLSGTLERMSGTYRALPSPPPAASLSKSDLRRMSAGSLSLEDRMRLMMLKDKDQEQEQQKSEAEVQRERRMRRASSKDSSPVREQLKPAMERVDNHSNEPRRQQQFQHVPRLSRDSILKELQSEADAEYPANTQHKEYSHQRILDPDVAIPSREDPTQHFDDDDEDEVVIKEEDADGDDLYSVPTMYGRHASGESAIDDGEGSQYSQPSVVGSVMPQMTDENHDTPRAQTPVQKSVLPSERMSLPDFMDFGLESSYDFGLSSYITPPSQEKSSNPSLSNEIISTSKSNLPDLAALRNSIQQPFASEERLEPPKAAFAEAKPSRLSASPASVIRHPMSESPPLQTKETETGAPSLDTTEKERSFATVSPQLQEDNLPVAEQTPTNTETDPIKEQSEGKRVSSLVQLDLPRTEVNEGLGLGLEKEFDRVVEAQKRGYLMRQNTKVVVASERGTQETSSTGPQEISLPPPTEAQPVPVPEPNQVQASPRKASQPTWVAEPWNGKVRRKSIRVGGEEPASAPKRKPVGGPAPPLPGQASNVNNGLGSLAEDELAEEEAEEFEDGTERGRLFVKVVGAKDLQLPFPLPQQEKSHFALTLDNGLHCVTTSWLDLARHAPIGQEFELVVLNDLEFQLTLQMKMDEPKIQQRPQSPTKAPASPKKQGALGRLFGSPKKKKESDARAQQEIASRQAMAPPATYDLVRGLVAKDGSFARAYVSLGEYEKQAYGRPFSVDIKCFNEWAMEEVSTGSSRSKKSATELQRRPPYEIGKLELQLLYVPKPKGAKDEDMPKSMNGAIRAMRDAEERAKQQSEVKEFEGHLSQQGGDCPYWRRRFFKLVGAKLTAYHETTHQPRATINLAKASKLIDDKTSLTQKDTTTKGGGRRKSAFADDEEGYMFIEEGFRIRFANGEVIDFYAESVAHKEEWMKTLSQVVGKGIASGSGPPKGWTDMVLKREKSLNAKAQSQKHGKDMQKPQPPLPQPQPQAQTGLRSPQKTTYGASGIPVANGGPSIPMRYSHGRTESYQGESRSQASSPVKSRLTKEDRNRRPKSMYA